MVISIELGSKPECLRRIVSLEMLFTQDICYLHAKDGLKPGHFFIHSSQFPWEPYLEKILQAWFHSSSINPPFRPLKRIPQEIIDALHLLPLSEKWIAIQELRKSGFLPQIKPLSPYHHPKEIPWHEMAKHVLGPVPQSLAQIFSIHV